MFMGRSFFESICGWARLVLRGRRAMQILSLDDLKAILGLEIVVFLAFIKGFRVYSRNKMFLLNLDFARWWVLIVTSQSDLWCIYSEYIHNITCNDALWHSCSMFFYASITRPQWLPSGFTSFNKNTMSCKQRTSAINYIMIKQIKLGIWLYAKVFWNSWYLYSISDNNGGNTGGNSPSESYCNLFSSLRGAFLKHLHIALVQCTFSVFQRLTLWTLQITHSTHIEPTMEWRLFVTNNFYTHHGLAVQESKFSYREMNILGTVSHINKKTKIPLT